MLSRSLSQPALGTLGSAVDITPLLTLMSVTMGLFVVGGEKDEVEDSTDLRRTESDSVLKKVMSRAC